MQTNNIRKAVIPAAGFGTRLFPTTKVIKKEFFPIIDRDGRAKPVIMAIVEEAICAGIEEVAIVVQKSDLTLFEDFFKTPPSEQLFKKLSPQNQKYSQYIQDLGSQITLLTQDEQEGFGHAVFCAREWVNDEPFVLLLGDHLYTSDTEISCCRQVLDVFEHVNQSVMGLRVTPANVIHSYGCVTGLWQESGSILSLTQIYEKPSLEYAQKHLQVEGMNNEEFLSVFGIYALRSKIFDYLQENISNNIRDKGEFQLTSCLERLRQEEGMTGYVVKGKCFDTGLPDAYWQTMIDFRNASHD